MELYHKQEHIKQGVMDASRKLIYGSVGEHGHDFFELEYIINGTGRYIVNGTSFPFQSNMLFFMSPASFHAVQDCNAEIINVMFPCTLCDTSILFQLYTLKANIIHVSANDNVLVEKLLMEIVDALKQGNTDYAVQFLRCLLYKLTTLTPTPQKQVATHIQHVILYILENFRSNISLQGAADHAGLVPSYLSALFLQETGIHFKEYVDNLRFDYACNLLSSTDINIAEVCMQSGFADYANFTRRFKERYHITPKSFRTKNELQR